MPYEFKFPDVGEGIAEGEIVKWRVKEGDRVNEHDILAEIETDKAVVEMPSPKSGTVSKILHKEGDTVKVGETLIIIETSEIIEKKEEIAKIPEVRPAGVVGFLEEATEVEKPSAAPKAEKEAEPQLLATPATRRLARELNVDLTKIKGSGLGGRITEEDIRKAAPPIQATAQVPIEAPKEQKEEVPAEPAVRITKKYDMYGYLEHVPLKGVRKAIARNMSKSFYTAPHVTHMDEADVTELYKLRNEEKKRAAEKGLHLTYLPYVIKAVIKALQAHPYLNAMLDDEHEEIVLKKYYNIGVAVDTPDGLIVPVIKIADQKSVYDLSREIEQLARRAHERKIDLGDLKGGTFTITNVGVIGGLHATPIINYPEVAILATGKIHDRVVMRMGVPRTRKMMPLSLSFDHRVVDGAEAARFVNKIILFLENPDLLLAE